jgi:hypothetical protein
LIRRRAAPRARAVFTYRWHGLIGNMLDDGRTSQTEPGHRLSAATEALAAYRAAELAVLKGQSVQLGERRVQLADLAEIRKGIAHYEAVVAAETARAAGRRSGHALADFGGCE